jgi:hypothetical protein
MDITWFWLGIYGMLYFVSGAIVGLFLGLQIRKYHGPPVRWVLEEEE